jgi:imidazolonepropionase-like amidohydrolase
LAWLSRAGLTQAQVLAAACVNGRVLLNQGSGRVAPGQPADLLLLKADPLNDPSAMEQVQALYVAGQELPR